MILSASRRTDIPGYYSEWFFNRLREGYVMTKNPMNPGQIGRINLSPDKIDCIVFWTKDPVKMLDQLPLIDKMGYPYYFQFTLTPYGKELERDLRDKADILATFRQLSLYLGKSRVLWRYDPIVWNEALTMDYHIRSFEKLCAGLEDYTDTCIISFVDFYDKLMKQGRNELLHEIREDQMHEIAGCLAAIAGNYGIELKACCEGLDFTKDGIKPSACIDKALVEQICGHAISARKDRSQRPECGCVQSVDIGVYNTCRNGCIYCYANHSEASIENNFYKHDPNSDILIGRIDHTAYIKDRN